MAGPRTCRSPCGNPCQEPLPIGKDELAEGAQEAPTDNSGTPVPTSRTLILASTPVLTPSSAPASTSKLFKKFMKACLENQTQAPAPSQAEPREQPLKAWFPDFYYKNLYIDCYHFSISVRTTLRPREPLGLIASHLPPRSCVGW